jgi:hypothetical protein
MSKRPAKEYEWEIIRIKGTPAVRLGRVTAPDAESAIKKAIKEFDIREPELQKRLAARRIG